MRIAPNFSDRAGTGGRPDCRQSYRSRPPYPDEVYAILEGLIVDTPRIVLERGCGLGEIARQIAAQVERVDAGDPSQAMLKRA